MASKGWTQADLAERSGVRPNTISDILNDQEPSNPRLDTMTALAHALGVPLWALFCDDREAVLFADHLRQATDTDRQLVQDIAAQVIAELRPELLRTIHQLAPAVGLATAALPAPAARAHDGRRRRR